MDVSDQLQSLEEKYKSVKVEFGIPPEYDLQSLSMININSIPIELANADKDQKEKILLEMSRNSTQFLINKLFELPRMSSEVEESTCIVLPPPNASLFPRFKPIPGPKALTRWEKFAKTRGIQNKKKSRKVYDDSTGEYKPRFGYGSKQVEQDWLIEVPKNADPMQDQYELKKEEKKERIEKNAKRNKRNQEELSASQLQRSNDRQSKKAKIEQDLKLTKTSTASLGKFDKKLQNEDKVKLKRGKQQVSFLLMNN